MSACNGMGKTEVRKGEKLRIFSKRECDALGGIIARDGECLKKGGGSYSYDCRNDENPTSVQRAARSLNDLIGQNSDELPTWVYIVAGVGVIYLALKVTQ
jgi:hypothetical protein